MTSPPVHPGHAGPAFTGSEPHTVAMVEDHEAVAFGVRQVLRSDPSLRMLGQFPTVDDMFERLGTDNPADLVLLDLRLADGSHPDINVSRLSEAGCGVLVYTSGENPHLVRMAAEAGVLGVVRKSRPMEELLDAVRSAVLGKPVPSTDWAAALDADQQFVNASLSARERQTLSLYASGEKSERVAEIMGISAETVNDYVGRIRAKYRKVGRPADTKVDLYKRAVEDGLLPVPGLPES